MDGEGSGTFSFSLTPQLQRRMMGALRGEAAVRPLTIEESQVAAKRLMAEARGFEQIDRALRDRKLLAMPERAHGYTPFSRVSATCKLIVVVPYSSPERESDIVASVGMSEGEPASGVLVRLENDRVAEFTTLDFLEGEFVTRAFRREELLENRPETLREDRSRGTEQADFEPATSSAIATDAFQGLLFDEHSSSIHSPSQQENMIHDMPLVSSIAELQYLRLQGLSASPDVSCCCCCCCCWGSCSSCA
jgi:hypothetical protein